MTHSELFEWIDSQPFDLKGKVIMPRYTAIVETASDMATDAYIYGGEIKGDALMELAQQLAPEVIMMKLKNAVDQHNGFVKEAQDTYDCKMCGKQSSVKEITRTLGKESSVLGKYCSAHCFTTAQMQGHERN